MVKYIVPSQCYFSAISTGMIGTLGTVDPLGGMTRAVAIVTPMTTVVVLHQEAQMIVAIGTGGEMNHLQVCGKGVCVLGGGREGEREREVRRRIYSRHQ